MDKLIWTTGKLPELGLMFLRNTLDKMHPGWTVRFGTTGKGLKPHYQIRNSQGKDLTFNGLSHEKFIDQDVFNDDNLSRGFDYDEITTALGITRKPK